MAFTDRVGEPVNAITVKLPVGRLRCWDDRVPTELLIGPTNAIKVKLPVGRLGYWNDRVPTELRIGPTGVL